MPRHFLSIVLAIDFDDADSDIGVQELVRKDLQYFYEDRAVNVLEVSLNNVQALDYIRRIEHEVKRIGIKEHAELPCEVSAVCEAYKITLPKMKKGAPPWRVPSEPCYGHVHALDSLSGKLVLTNGIKAFVIREDGKWCDVHLDWFVPDDVNTLPEEFRTRKPREKKMVLDFNQFNLEDTDGQT